MRTVTSRTLAIAACAAVCFCLAAPGGRPSAAQTKSRPAAAQAKKKPAAAEAKEKVKAEEAPAKKDAAAQSRADTPPIPAGKGKMA